MTARAVVAVAFALAACSDIGSSDDTVIALQVTSPPGASVDVGDSVQYTAIALNRNGDPIPAPIRWATPDTANIAVDSLSGVVLGKKGATQARVQASSQGLVSSLNIITVIAVADTLILMPPDTLRVDALPATTSAAMVSRLESFNPVGPLSGRLIIYEVIEPVFGSPASATVTLSNGALSDTATTGANGEPSTPITLSRVTGFVAPDSAIVEIRATRRQGTQPVPGSGQRWIVRFTP
jgi:hypothetical protein